MFVMIARDRWFRATHSSVVYGIMEDGSGGVWIALRDTWDSTATPLVENMYEDRIGSKTEDLLQHVRI